MSKRYVDLHIHTTASDGTYPLTRVLEEYYAKGYLAIAITDHDTVDAFNEFPDDYYKTMRVIKGVEISSRYANREVHILGYDIDYKNPKLLDLLNRIKISRIERAKKMVSRLQDLGKEIKYSDVLEFVGDENIIGRPHIARTLLKNGEVLYEQQAFDEYIGDNGIAYVAKAMVSPEEVITTIHQAGGFAVLAHPFKSLHLEDIHYFKKYGIDGIETYYYDHTSEQVEQLESLCKNMDLLATGGSDFHGSGKRDKIGTYTGNLKIINDINRVLHLKIEVPNEKSKTI